MSLTAAQQALRLQGLGASEIGSIVGAAGAYETPLSIWARKVGLVVEDDSETPEHIELGNLLEPVVASLYTRRTGRELYEPGTMAHPSDPLRVATPDRLVRGEPRGVQIKKARTKGTWGREGTDEIPENIVAQCQWEMSVANLEIEDVPVLFWGSRLAIYTLRRDDELIEGLAEIAHKWWRDHVVARVPPTPDSSARTKETLAKIFPTNRGNLKRVGPPSAGIPEATLFAFAQDYVLARNEASEAEERKEKAANALRMFVGDADGFEAPWGKVTWKLTSSGRVDWKGIAEELHPDPELVRQFTAPPERRLNVTVKGANGK